MIERVWQVTIDPERVETDPTIEPGRRVCGRGEIGWLTNSRCVAEELSSVAHTGERWGQHSTSDSGTELVTAVLKACSIYEMTDCWGHVNAFERVMTGDDLQANMRRNSRRTVL